MKNLIFILSLFVGVLFAHAETIDLTDLSQRDYAIYMESTTAQRGNTVDVYLKLKSAMVTGGFQTELILPTGVTVQSCSALNPNEIMTFDGDIAKNGNYRIIFVYKANSRPSAMFDSAVVKITLKVDDDVAVGDYPVIFTAQEISSESGAAGTAKLPEKVTCLLKVQEEEVFADGYSVAFNSFFTKSGLTHDSEAPAESTSTWITLSLTNKLDISEVSFTLSMPEGFSVGTYTFKKKEYPDLYYAWETDDTPECTDNGDGTYSVKADYSISAGEKVPSIMIPLVTAQVLNPKEYPITISDIVFTTSDHRTYKAAPFTENVTLAMVDLRESDEENITIDSSLLPNAIIYAKNGSQATNSSNVVIDGVCQNLVVTDGSPFILFEEFEASKATYTRNMSNTWGTICLPFELKESANEKYYKIAGISDEMLVLEKMQTVPAGTAAIVRKLNGDRISLLSNDVQVESAIVDNSTDDYPLHGSYLPIEVKDANAYYILNDHFWRRALGDDSYFVINPFRAYFTLASAYSAHSFGLAVSGEDETDITNILFGENNTSVEGIYDISGKRARNFSDGVNIVKLTNGITYKVIIK